MILSHGYKLSRLKLLKNFREFISQDYFDSLLKRQLGLEKLRKFQIWIAWGLIIITIIIMLKMRLK